MKKLLRVILLAALLLACSAAMADTLRLPAGLKNIEAEAFAQDTGLDEIVLPEGLERIESRAFAGSSLREIFLPSSLRFIADDAFQNCEDLTVTAPPDSYAYAWAVERGFFSLPETTEVSVPAALEAGENLTVRVTGPANTVRHNVFLIDSNKKGTMRTIDSASGETTWYGYKIEPGAYRVIVYTFTDDYQTLNPIAKSIEVTGEKPDGPALDIPETETYSYREYPIEVGSPYSVTFEIKDAQGKTIDSFSDYSTNGTAAWLWLGYDELKKGGSIDYSISAYINGKWTKPTKGSIAIVKPYDLQPPELNAPETSLAGQDLTFSYSSVEHAGTYYVSLYRYIGNDFEHATMTPYKWYEGWTLEWEETKSWGYNEGKTVTVPGYDIISGKYLLRAGVCREGTEGGESVGTSQIITITGERPAAPEVTVNKTEAYSDNDTVICTIQASNAEIARVTFEYYNEKGERRNIYSDYVSIDENGVGEYRSPFWYETAENWSIHYKVCALIDGIWSAWSEPLIVQMKEREMLAAPVVAVPETIQAGQDFSFSFEAVNHADNYRAEISHTYTGYVYEWSSNNCKPGATITLPGHYLSKGSYKLTVTAYASDYRNSSTEQSFTVTGTKPAAPEITVDKEEIHINEKTQFSLSGEGIEGLFVTYSGDNGYNYWGNIFTNVSPLTGNTYVWNWTAQEYYLGATFTFKFSAKQNGLWSAWKTLTYVIQDQPALPAPVLHAEASYPAGADITLTFDEVEHAESYNCRIYNSDNNTVSRSFNSSQRECLLYGYNIEPGEYRFVVTASSSQFKSSTSEAAFTIIGKKTPGPQVTVDNTECLAGDICTFIISSNEADEICYDFEHNNSSGSWDGDTGRINVFSDSTVWESIINFFGKYTYQFSVLKDGKWSAWSEPIEVYAGEKPPVDPPQITAEDRIYRGKDLTVSLTGPEDVNRFRIYIYRSNGNIIFSTTIYEAGSITIPGYLLPLGSLTISVTAYTDSGSSSSTKTVRVLSSDLADAPQVTPPEKTTLSGYDRYSFSLDTNGAESAAVRYYRIGNPNGVQYQDITVGDTGSAKWNTYLYSWDEKGTYAYSFSVKKNGVWSNWSDEIYITLE